jgi:plasmid maintenance system antidote protein VapI
MKNHPHPGRIVRQDFLEPLDLTVTEAAKVLGVARQTMNNLVNEKAGCLASTTFSGQRRLEWPLGLRGCRSDSREGVDVTL